MTAALAATYDSSISRVSLVATGLNASTASSIVYRWDNGVPETVPRANIVRGSQTAVGASFTIFDYEFSVGVPLNYQIITYDSSGTVLDTVNATVLTVSQPVAWLKSIARPFLNIPVEAIDFGAITYAARMTTFNVLNSSYPTAVTDTRGGRNWSLTLRTLDDASRDDLNSLLDAGDILFLQGPDGNALPVNGYFAVGDVTATRPNAKHNTLNLNYVLTLTEVEAPAPSIIGYAATCADILANFATCAVVLSDFATCAALLLYVA